MIQGYSSAQETENSSKVLGKINNVEITDKEVTKRVQRQIERLEKEIYEIKREGLIDLVEEKMLEAEAKKQNKSLDEFLKAEIQNKVTNPNDKEIEAFYKENEGQFRGQPLEKVKAAISRQLKNSKERNLYVALIKKVKSKNKVELFMDRARAEVSIDDDPSQGSATAKITLIEFSDFQCPYCRKTRPTIKKILETYPGKIKYVFRDFPLGFHHQSPKAHQAANCSKDQNKYWEYNSLLWERFGKIQISDLKGYAKELGLDQKKFDECLDSDKYASEVEKDINDGAQAGVSGTPAYFINGILLSGAQPFEEFQKLIEEELQ